MKRIVSVMLLAVCAAANGSQFMGGPVPETKGGGWALWGSYSDATTEVVALDFPNLPGLEFDLDVSSFLIGGEYGLADSISVYGGVGGASIEVEEFSDSGQLTVVGGLRGAYEVRPKLWLGGLGQIDFFAAKDKFDNTVFDLDCVEFQLAMALEYRADRWRVYGGPFYHRLDGDLTVSYSDYDGMFRFKSDVEAKDDFGVYGGGSVCLSSGVSMGAEYRTTGGDDGWSVFVGIVF